MTRDNSNADPINVDSNRDNTRAGEGRGRRRPVEVGALGAGGGPCHTVVVIALRGTRRRPGLLVRCASSRRSRMSRLLDVIRLILLTCMGSCGSGGGGDLRI